MPAGDVFSIEFVYWQQRNPMFGAVVDLVIESSAAHVTCAFVDRYDPPRNRHKSLAPV
jgi:hypothetical protein